MRLYESLISNSIARARRLMPLVPLLDVVALMMTSCPADAAE